MKFLPVPTNKYTTLKKLCPHWAESLQTNIPSSLLTHKNVCGNTVLPGEKMVGGEHFVTFGTLEGLVPVDGLDVARDVGLSKGLTAVVTDDFLQALFLLWPLLDWMVVHVVLPEQSPLFECRRAVATPLHEDAIVNFLNVQPAKHKTSFVFELDIWSTFRNEVLHSRPSKW